MSHRTRRLVDRPREAARPLHGRTADHPPPAPRADRRGRARRPHWRRSSRPARAAGARGTRRREPAPPPRRRRRPASPRPRSPRSRPPPTPVPTPEKELFVYNWDATTSAEDTRRASRRSTASRSSTTTFPDDPTQLPSSRATARAAATTSATPGPTTSRALVEAGRRPEGRQGPDPQHRQPRHRVGESRLRPEQRVLGARTCGGRPATPGTRTRSRTTSRAGRPSGTPRFDNHINMLDDLREMLRGRGDPAGQGRQLDG